MSEHPERKEIIKKHSAAIHIQNNITLLQRRAWNVLLYHAYDELPRHERHHVPVKVLIAQLEFDSKNEDYLREALKGFRQLIAPPVSRWHNEPITDTRMSHRTV